MLPANPKHWKVGEQASGKANPGAAGLDAAAAQEGLWPQRECRQKEGAEQSSAGVGGPDQRATAALEQRCLHTYFVESQ